MRATRPTVSFILLVTLAVIASFGAYVLSTRITPREELPAAEQTKPEQTHQPDKTKTAQTLELNTNTDTWEEYTDPTYYLSFKHPEDWTVETYPNRAGYYVIAIRAKQGTDSIRIYVNPDHYSGLTGLPSTKDKLAGISAINVNDVAVGVKYAAQYYTFDMGTDIRLQPAFKAMLNTVAFSK